jgi:hypothetical protein
LVVAHLEWPLMQVLPLSLRLLRTMKSEQRVYVDVYARRRGGSSMLVIRPNLVA